MEDCAMVQNALFGRVPFWPGFGIRDTAGNAANAPSRVNVASAQHDVSGSLSVVTKEGDTVTLSASYDATLTYAGIRSGNRGARFSSAQVSRSLSLQVQGDLSEQELREIRQVVKRFMHDLREMIRGGQPSIANVTDVHATTLASISASTNTQDTVVAASITSRPLPAAVPLGNDVPQDSPARRAPLAGEDTDTTPAPSPLVSARGLDSTTPVGPSILTQNGSPVRS
jgi:hypothetical protein